MSNLNQATNELSEKIANLIKAIIEEKTNNEAAEKTISNKTTSKKTASKKTTSKKQNITLSELRKKVKSYDDDMVTELLDSLNIGDASTLNRRLAKLEEDEYQEFLDKLEEDDKLEDDELDDDDDDDDELDDYDDDDDDDDDDDELEEDELSVDMVIDQLKAYNKENGSGTKLLMNNHGFKSIADIRKTTNNKKLKAFYKALL